ncbi:hypothetical protein POM88_033352 [Heracleum sosnowskyi]|uniref:UspA domain-containing protein n=1 Tax=Heracleum sosnowskyi TaxID=360622 RepID=A0AAD8I2A6_9APIA|nr:hypothetical protein POM88_033352 [Heracleum sosnowskyi]
MKKKKKSLEGPAHSVRTPSYISTPWLAYKNLVTLPIIWNCLQQWGSKPGSGGAASAQNEAIDRRERLRRLALETIDLAKDAYFMRKRQQTNLAKRAAREAKDPPAQPQPHKRKVNLKKCGYMFSQDIAKKPCQDYPQIKVEIKVGCGDARDVICEVLEKLNVDMVVLGSHGYGALKR